MAELMGIPVIVDSRMPEGFVAIVAGPGVPPVVFRVPDLPKEASDG